MATFASTRGGSWSGRSTVAGAGCAASASRSGCRGEAAHRERPSGWGAGWPSSRHLPHTAPVAAWRRAPVPAAPPAALWSGRAAGPGGQGPGATTTATTLPHTRRVSGDTGHGGPRALRTSCSPMGRRGGGGRSTVLSSSGGEGSIALGAGGGGGGRAAACCAHCVGSMLRSSSMAAPCRRRAASSRSVAPHAPATRPSATSASAAAHGWAGSGVDAHSACSRYTAATRCVANGSSSCPRPTVSVARGGPRGGAVWHTSLRRAASHRPQRTGRSAPTPPAPLRRTASAPSGTVAPASRTSSKAAMRPRSSIEKMAAVASSTRRAGDTRPRLQRTASPGPGTAAAAATAVAATVGPTSPPPPGAPATAPEDGTPLFDDRGTVNTAALIQVRWPLGRGCRTLADTHTHAAAGRTYERASGPSPGPAESRRGGGGGGTRRSPDHRDGAAHGRRPWPGSPGACAARAHRCGRVRGTAPPWLTRPRRGHSPRGHAAGPDGTVCDADRRRRGICAVQHLGGCPGHVADDLVRLCVALGCSCCSGWRLCWRWCMWWSWWTTRAAAPTLPCGPCSARHTRSPARYPVPL
jgi:hypothetical protein